MNGEIRRVKAALSPALLPGASPEDARMSLCSVLRAACPAPLARGWRSGVLPRIFHTPLRAPYTPRRCAPPLCIEGISIHRCRSPLYQEGCPTGRGVLVWFLSMKYPG